MNLNLVCWSNAMTAIFATSSVETPGFQVEETTTAGVHEALQAKQVPCHQIVRAYLKRIAAYDHNGPALNAILTPSKALAEAERLDVSYARV
jgi:amidase